MATHLGGAAAPAKVPEFGKSVVKVHEPDVLFEGLPDRFEVWESHNDEVTKIPPGFTPRQFSELQRPSDAASRPAPVRPAIPPRGRAHAVRPGHFPKFP